MILIASRNENLCTTVNMYIGYSKCLLEKITINVAILILSLLIYIYIYEKPSLYLNNSYQVISAFGTSS